jgi:hypothetical protein
LFSGLVSSPIDYTIISAIIYTLDHDSTIFEKRL